MELLEEINSILIEQDKLNELIEEYKWISAEIAYDQKKEEEYDVWIEQEIK